MTLIDCIEDYNDKVVFHIGSKSGFFFIGTKKEFFRDVDSIDESIISNWEKELDRDEKDYKKFLKLLNSAKKLDDDEEEIESFFSQIKQNVNRAEKAWTASCVLRKNLNDYVPIRQRIVIEKYPKIIDDEGLIIIVEGNEQGRF